jgi:hypothetical protein
VIKTLAEQVITIHLPISSQWLFFFFLIGSSSSSLLDDDDEDSSLLLLLDEDEVSFWALRFLAPAEIF